MNPFLSAKLAKGAFCFEDKYRIPVMETLSIKNRNYTVSVDDNKEVWTEVVFSGRIDASTIDQFMQGFDDQLDLDQNKIIANLNKVEYIASTGLGGLLKYHNLFEHDGGKMILLHPPEVVMGVLELLGFQDILYIIKSKKAFFKEKGAILINKSQSNDDNTHISPLKKRNATSSAKLKKIEYDKKRKKSSHETEEIQIVTPISTEEFEQTDIKPKKKKKKKNLVDNTSTENKDTRTPRKKKVKNVSNKPLTEAKEEKQKKSKTKTNQSTKQKKTVEEKIKTPASITHGFVPDPSKKVEQEKPTRPRRRIRMFDSVDDAKSDILEPNTKADTKLKNSKSRLNKKKANRKSNQQHKSSDEKNNEDKPSLNSKTVFINALVFSIVYAVAAFAFYTYAPQKKDFKQQLVLMASLGVYAPAIVIYIIFKLRSISKKAIHADEED